jgi:hypothetical protein
LAPFLQAGTCHSCIEIDPFDADGETLSITSPSETLSHSHKFNLKEPSPFNWLTLAASNLIACGRSLTKNLCVIG